MFNPKLHFQRFEFKYLLNFEQLRKIRSFLKRYVIPDDFAQNTKNGFYEVISLYYDSPKFYYYWEKIDGVQKRKKIRLRTYKVDGQLIDYAFFEVKRKYDAIILKDRFLLTNEDYKELMAKGNFLNSSTMENSNKDKIIEEFQWEKGKHQLSPKILVVYNREPYLGKFNKNFRITFDYGLKAREDDDLFYQGNNYFDVSGAQVIMEIKFNGKLPFYVQQIIDMYDLERIAYSKYCYSVESCYNLPILNLSRTNFLIFPKEL